MLVKVRVQDVCPEIVAGMANKDLRIDGNGRGLGRENITFLYASEDKNIIPRTIRVNHSDLQGFIGSVDRVRADRTVSIPSSAIIFKEEKKEKGDEKGNTRFASKFSIRGWGGERGLPNVRRGQQQGAEPSNNSGTERGEVDMPQGVVPRTRSRENRQRAVFSNQIWDTISASDYTTRFSTGAFAELLQDSDIRATAPPASQSSEGVQPENSVRQRWSRARDRMATNGINI